MDEMNALERQIGRVARQQVGPLAPSDAAAVARGAITPAARWQVGGLFRFAGAAIAGVTILLVGVFVVVALLATDDGAERLPAVGAPASASPEAATADPSLSPTLPASILPPDRSGGFGSASPVWVMDIVEGSSGGNSQIDWYEPEGVIDRRLYTTTCQPRCDVGSVPMAGDFELFDDEPYTSDGPDGPMAGVIYPMPDPPAEIWWMVELEFDPTEHECASRLDADGRCWIASGPWRWFSVPEDEPKVVPSWGEDYIEGGNITQIGWFEPTDVADQRMYWTACRPDCGGQIPGRSDMEQLTDFGPLEAIEGTGHVETLFRQPRPGPAEVWWMVELDFPPGSRYCDRDAPPEDGCTIEAGPWRYLYDEVSQLSTEAVEPGVVRVTTFGDIEPLIGSFERLLAVTPDRQVWLTDDGRTFSATGPGEAPAWDGSAPVVAPDSTLWAIDARVLHRFDGSESGEGERRDWVPVDPPEGWDGVDDVAVGADGTVWVSRSRDGYSEVARGDGDGWTAMPPIDAGSSAPLPFVVTADGELLKRVGGQLYRYSDGEWSDFAIDLPDPPRAKNNYVAAGADGSIWVSACADYLLRYLDGSWSRIEPSIQFDGCAEYSTSLHAGPDGRLWVTHDHANVGLATQDLVERGIIDRPEGPPESWGCPGLLSYDGERWQQYLAGRCIDAVVTEPDGTAWASSSGSIKGAPGEPVVEDPFGPGLYIIRPE